MGLYKRIRSAEGVPLTYHRIFAVQHAPYLGTQVEVMSYIDHDEREAEKAWDGEGEPPEVYVNSSIYGREFDDSIGIVAAYEWLKTLDEFKDAENIFED